jgi:ketosteroid isomerase-like protein
MSTQENVQIVNNFLAALGRRDMQDLLALSAEDIEWIIPGEDWPLAGNHRGHAGLANLLQKANETVETSYPEPPEFIAQGDRILVVGFATGRVKATNRTFEDHWVFAITVRDGKVTNIREYIDTQALERASEMDGSPAVGSYTADTTTVIQQAYSAFNRRDIDGALALMTEDVSWPKASEGGKVVGKEEIRVYWTRQWREFDGHVEALEITEEDRGKVRVKVHQRIKNLQGEVLWDGEVLHVFTVNSGLIAAMDLGDEDNATAGPTAAFAHRS